MLVVMGSRRAGGRVWAPLDQGQMRVLVARVTVAMLPVPGGDGQQVDLDHWKGQLAQAEGRCEIRDSPLGSRECCDLI